MKEMDFATRIDRYFRREDTILAHALRTISPDVGQEYRGSPEKRVTELVIATPLAVATLPVLGVLAAAKNLKMVKVHFMCRKDYLELDLFQ